MAPESINRLTFGGLAMVMLLALLLVALDMMSSAVQNSDALSQWFVPLLVFTVLSLVTLALLIGYNLYRLLRESRRRVAGSRLTARLVVLFTVLSVVPASVVYYYSLQFLVRGIDSWFDVKIDGAMEDALRLGRASLDIHKREFLKRSENLLRLIEDSSQTALALSLGDLRRRAEAVELVLLDSAGRVRGASHADPEVVVPDIPEIGLIQQVQNGESQAALVTVGSAGQLHVRCLVRDPLERGLLLQALYPIADTISGLSTKVQDAYVDYKQRIYLRRSIKLSFSLTLSLVLAAALFSAVWVAFVTARRLVAPISNIAAGTEAVAAGDYDQQLPLPHERDELSFLVGSFNAMTRRIAQARNLAQDSERKLESQRAYLETVLGSLSGGVMALDVAGRIQTANPAASQILRVSLARCLGEPLAALSDLDAQLTPFVEGLQHCLPASGEQWSEQIELYRSEGRQVLLCRCSTLVVEGADSAGFVLVFDDITALVKAQRDAAWGEVARRLAHEIKNPLTPIQLAAERLRHKYLQRLGAADGEILDRATHTIVQQVDAMKAMVNAFSDYAKPSQMAPEPLCLDAFVAGVVSLYDGSRPEIRCHRGAGALSVEADPVRLRQVLHNLVKNAREAVNGQADASVEVQTATVRHNDAVFAEVRVQDNGSGFDPDALGHVFEPYVTTKAKGTGLGLAIVKKIVEEHGGSIWAENAPAGGGRVVMRLPAQADARPGRCPPTDDSELETSE